MPLGSPLFATNSFTSTWRDHQGLNLPLPPQTSWVTLDQLLNLSFPHLCLSFLICHRTLKVLNLRGSLGGSKEFNLVKPQAACCLVWSWSPPSCSSPPAGGIRTHIMWTCSPGRAALCQPCPPQGPVSPRSYAVMPTCHCLGKAAAWVDEGTGAGL